MGLKSCLAFVWLVMAASSHADVQSTVPNAFAAAPAGGTFLGPLANAQRTYQLLIGQSQITAHLGNALTGITFRLPPSATADWPAAALTFASYDIRLSASVAPADRSLTFANNVVGTQTLVRSGALTLSPGSFDSGSSPNAFGVGINFDSAYTYGGGNLLIEIRHTGFSGTSTSVDAVLASAPPAAGYGTLFSAAWTANYAGTSGAQGNFAVLQITSVPEPATAILLAAGIVALIARRRR
ncbi:MAG: PEP-CTERM sorting domain-containing protein [Chitinophagaceae bacterium]|nr:PEP-CTERM sorting domain-containing protein [Rubrivivax sp.]